MRISLTFWQQQQQQQKATMVKERGLNYLNGSFRIQNRYAKLGKYKNNRCIRWMVGKIK